MIIKEAVANGRLTEAGDAAGALASVAASHHTSVDAVAIAAALAQPGIQVVLSGAASLDQLRSNLVALDLPTMELPALAEPAEAYWSARSSRPWT